MTDPVILYGTTSSGESLPVQVDGTGRLVAEGLQGPPGQDGEGVPEPYGEDGSVLTIQDGVPAWVVPSPPEPPTPANYIALIDERSETPPGTANYGLRNNAGALFYPEDPWDTAIRTLDCWENPTNGDFGLGCNMAGDNSSKELNMPFKLDLSGGEGKVLQLKLSHAWLQFPSSYEQAKCEITTSDTRLSPLVTEAGTMSSGGQELRTFTFLVTQADIGEVPFNLRGFFLHPADLQEVRWLTLQHWEYVEPSLYFLDMAKQFQIGMQESTEKEEA